jgi:hypothetical protein
VNGHEVETSAREGTGQILIPISAGMNQVELRFVQTWDRAMGGWITLISIASVLVWFAVKGKSTTELSHVWTLH